MEKPKAKNKLFSHMLEYNIRDKDRALKHFRESVLNKTNQIFEYRGLPDSIPAEILERFLQTNGNVLFHEVKGELYVFTGGLGGQQDVYYRPTLYTVANPALSYSKNVVIGTEGILMKNDMAMQGLLPLIYKYGTLLAEADISFYISLVNTRDTNAMSAGDDATKASAEEYQRQIEAGYTAVIGESGLLEDAFKRHPMNSNSSSLKDLKEVYQYLKAQLYYDLGMKVQDNMKSQYVSDEENIINDDALLPSIDNMLDCRQKAIKEVNALYGTNIEVELRGTWKLQQAEIERAIEMMEAGSNGEEQESNEASVIEELPGAGEEGRASVEEPDDGNTGEEPEPTEDEPEITIEININTDDDTETETEGKTEEDEETDGVEDEEDKKNAN